MGGCFVKWGARQMRNGQPGLPGVDLKAKGVTCLLRTEGAVERELSFRPPGSQRLILWFSTLSCLP